MKEVAFASACAVEDLQGPVKVAAVMHDSLYDDHQARRQVDAERGS
nr:H193 [uncultured bacterium]